MEATKIILASGYVIIALIWTVYMPYPLLEYYRKFARKKRIPLSIMWGALIVLQLVSDVAPFPQGSMLSYVERTGLVLFALGLILAVWGRLSMGSDWGIPAQYDASKQKHLITAGAFQLSRNPIYAGLLILFLGSEMALKSWLVLLIIPLALFTRQVIKKEEKLMAKHFGDEWEDYKSRVARFFVVV